MIRPKLQRLFVGGVVMSTKRLSSVAIALLLLAWGAPIAHADGVCTRRPPTAAETTTYTAAYELFRRVAPTAPSGWATDESPPTGAIPTLCLEYGNSPPRRGFQRRFTREVDRQARDDQAVQAYTAMAQRQQAQAAANKAQIDAVDAKINSLTTKMQEAAAAQRFGDMESLGQQMDTLMQQRTKLAGYNQIETETAQIEAEHSRDTEASFQLWFEAPRNEPRSGQPYRTSAGQAFLSAYDDKGNPIHDVEVHFAGAPEQARVRVTGPPERVRALLDAADLKAIAAFR